MLLKRKKGKKFTHTHTISQQRIFNAIKNTQKTAFLKKNHGDD